jgi:hypothetical protein
MEQVPNTKLVKKSAPIRLNLFNDKAVLQIITIISAIIVIKGNIGYLVQFIDLFDPINNPNQLEGVSEKDKFTTWNKR